MRRIKTAMADSRRLDRARARLRDIAKLAREISDDGALVQGEPWAACVRLARDVLRDV